MNWKRTLLPIQSLFKRRPFVTNVTSYGFFYVSAEVTQQWMDRRFRKGDRFQQTVDWKSLFRYGFIGTVAIAPYLFVWYRILDKLIIGRTFRHTVAKVVLDQSLSSSTCLVIFFVGMSALEGKEDIFQELKKKFWSTYMVSCCFWPTVQAINFGLLPPHTRVAFVGATSFVWANVLCLIKRRQSAPTDAPSVAPSVAASSDEQQKQVTKLD